MKTWIGGPGWTGSGDLFRLNISERESYLAQRGNIPQTMTSKTGLYNEEMKINPGV